jgi:zinc transporter 9
MLRLDTKACTCQQDGAAVAGLAVAGLALAAVEFTGQRIWDPIGSIVVGQLLGVVAIFLIQRNRQALLGRSIDDLDMRRVINLLISDPVPWKLLHSDSGFRMDIF